MCFLKDNVFVEYCFYVSYRVKPAHTYERSEFVLKVMFIPRPSSILTVHYIYSNICS